MAAGPIVTRNQGATVYVGGFDEKVSEEVLWELFLQAGRVVNIHLPKDRISQAHQGYGFVELFDEDDAEYAVRIMNMIKLYGKPIRVNKASAHQKSMDIGANIFIGNLDPEVDEKLIYDTFSAFGVLLQVPKIVRDPSTGNSRGFCFLHYGCFEASDAAITAMHNQHLCNRVVSVSYAYRKDVATEIDRRHGSAAERLLAARNPIVKNSRPNQLFADAPPLPVVAPPPPLPPTLSDTIAPPPLPPPPMCLSGATAGGFSCAPLPPPPLPLMDAEQELATLSAQPAIQLAGAVSVPAVPCTPPPPPPHCAKMTSRVEHSMMEGADPPPLGRIPPPPPSNMILQQGLQSISMSLPPPPPPPYSPMTSPMPSPMTSPMAPPPPPPPSPSWNGYQRSQPPAQLVLPAPHPNRFVELAPQYLMNSPSSSPLAPQHSMNRPPLPDLVDRRNGFNQMPFMQGNRSRPPYWNDSHLYQDSRRR